jgi:hypothetical protein
MNSEDFSSYSLNIKLFILSELSSPASTTTRPMTPQTATTTTSVGLTVPPLPSSAVIHYFHLPCLVSVPLSTTSTCFKPHDDDGEAGDGFEMRMLPW